MTYDRTRYVDPLFPEGRVACHRCLERPAYLAGLCGACFAAQGEAERHAKCDHPAWCAVTGEGDPEAAPVPARADPRASWPVDHAEGKE